MPMGLPVEWDTCIDIKKIKLDRNRFLKGGNRPQVSHDLFFDVTCNTNDPLRTCHFVLGREMPTRWQVE